MVKLMNKIIPYGSFAIAIGLIIGVTTYKVVSMHNEKVLLVQHNYIIEQAKNCLNEKKCSGDAITLKELYKNGLDRQANDVTKEYYNEDSYVEVKDSKYRFVIVN